CFFFFQAEDGIRDFHVTGVQTCALPIWHFILAVGNDGQFARFCAVVGLDALAKHPDFATNSARIANRAALREHMVAALATFTGDALLPKLEAAGVPASPINTIGQMFADPQVAARGQRMDLDDGRANTL